MGWWDLRMSEGWGGGGELIDAEVIRRMVGGDT